MSARKIRSIKAYRGLYKNLIIVWLKTIKFKQQYLQLSVAISSQEMNGVLVDGCCWQLMFTGQPGTNCELAPAPYSFYANNNHLPIKTYSAVVEILFGLFTSLLESIKAI